uniref:Uncharacterized protein n=1 Tax=Globisporangium ultimum (strain ATCC 200006 / CBS 805.95 / DAOM BR144) TaxID=431595 RepID=K3W930_GLOUD
MVLPKYQLQRRRQYAAGVAALALFLIVLGLGQLAFVLLLTLLPVIVFFTWVFKQQQHHGVTDNEITQLFYCFVAGIFPSAPLVLAAQSMLVPLAALLCFFDQKDALNQQLRTFLDIKTADATSGAHHTSRVAEFVQQLQVDKTVGYYCFVMLLAFVVAALVEEFAKLWIVQGTWCCRSSCCCAKATTSTSRKPGAAAGRPSSPGFPVQRARSRGWLCDPRRLLFQHQKHSSHSFVVFMAVVAGALGFSWIENVLYTFGAPTFGDRVIAAVLRGCMSTSLHCICGGITGVRLAQRQARGRLGVPAAGGASEKSLVSEDLAAWRTKLSILGPAVLIHGSFDLQLLGVASLLTNDMMAAHPILYGILVPFIGPLLLLGGSFWYLRRSLHTMEQQMNAGRYIQVAVDLESGKRMGFSVDDSDSDESDDEFAQQSSNGSGAGSARKTRAVFNI